MLRRPALRFQPHPRLLATRLADALLDAHPAAGRHGRGRVAIGSERPTIHDAAYTLVRWAGDGQPFGQAGLARAVGLSRPTICAYLGVWLDAGLVERVDEAGGTVERGTTTAPGSAALYRLTATWTPELVDLMPAAWRPRLEMAWACLRAGAPDEMIGNCLRRTPASNGERVLIAWYGRSLRRRRKGARRHARALQAAEERRERNQSARSCDALAVALLRLASTRTGNSTPPLTETTSSALKGLEVAPNSAHARKARRGKPVRRTEPSADQYRLVIEAGVVNDLHQAGGQWADLVQSAELVGEVDPVAVWGQVARIAITGMVRWRGRPERVAEPGALRLDEMIGRYQRAADRVRADLSGGKDGAAPVEYMAAVACYWLRRELIEARPDAAPVTPAKAPTVASQPPPAAPAVPLAVSKAPVAGASPPRRSLAAMLAAVRSARRDMGPPPGQSRPDADRPLPSDAR